jgi:hypothetical protein
MLSRKARTGGALSGNETNQEGVLKPITFHANEFLAARKQKRLEHIAHGLG